MDSMLSLWAAELRQIRERQEKLRRASQRATAAIRRGIQAINKFTANLRPIHQQTSVMTGSYDDLQAVLNLRGGGLGKG